MKFEENVMFNGHIFDYKLEDGTLLDSDDWNGERYHDGKREFKPIYRYEAECIDMDALEENSDEWDRAVEIVDFVEC